MKDSKRAERTGTGQTRSSSRKKVVAQRRKKGGKGRAAKSPVAGDDSVATKDAAQHVIGLIKRGALKQARVELFAAAEPVPAPAFMSLARAYGQRTQWKEAAAVARRGCAVHPSHAALRLGYAKYLLSAGQLDKTLKVVARAPRYQVEINSQFFGLLYRASKAFKARGDMSGSIKALEQAVALRPDNETVLVRLVMAFNVAGRWDEGAPYRARLQQVRMKQLPSSLADGLDALQQLPADPNVPEDALQWAWELADKSAWTWQDWRAAVDWGYRAHLLLANWWICAAGPTREIRALTDAPDLTEMRRAIGNDRGCVLVGSHLGPIAAAVQLFQTFGPPFRVLGGAGGGQLDPRAEPIVIPTQKNPIATTREVVSELSRGSIVGVVNDFLVADQNSKRSVVVSFLGRRIVLSTFAPRLIRRSAVPSFWCVPLWRDGRIVIELERLPDPIENEPEDIWISRWNDAFLANLERVMRGHPANLSLGDGVWRFAKLTKEERKSTGSAP